MPPLRRILPFLVAGLSFLPASHAVAQLVDTSPFTAPGAASSGPGGADTGSLELRGIMSTPDGARYCIYDPVKKSGTWVGVNERGSSFVIRSADPQRQAVTVQADGRTVRLVLRASKTAALGAQPGAGITMGGPAGVPNRPSPADEAARLQAVAEAVRARRQMREQAAQGGGTGAAPVPAATDNGQGNQRRGRQRQQGP